MNAWAMNIARHDPNVFMIIGMGQAAGFIAVPDDRFIRNMPAGFMSIMFMPGISMPSPWS